MKNPIIIAGTVVASVADLLNDTRLQTLPSAGVLTVELQSSAQSATNNFTTSVQLPSGDTPMNGTGVPAGVTSGALNANDKTQASFLVQQGGHATISFDLTGTATLAYRITFTPAG